MKKELYISDAEGYNFDGSIKYPSRFIFNTSLSNVLMLNELDENLIDEASEYIIEKEQLLDRDASQEALKASKSSLNVGDIVSHAILGKGEIVQLYDDDFVEIKFMNFDTSRRLHSTSIYRENESEEDDED